MQYDVLALYVLIKCLLSKNYTVIRMLYSFKVSLQNDGGSQKHVTRVRQTHHLPQKSYGFLEQDEFNCFSVKSTKTPLMFYLYIKPICPLSLLLCGPLGGLNKLYNQYLTMYINKHIQWLNTKFTN